MNEHTVAAYAPIAHHFCGQQQPHAAHTWETPPVYGAATFVSIYQCAGLAIASSPSVQADHLCDGTPMPPPPRPEPLPNPVDRGRPS